MVSIDPNARNESIRMNSFEGLDSADGLGAANRGVWVRAGRMFLRGLPYKPFLGASTGPLFVGRNVRLSGLRHVKHSGRLVIEDGVELQGLAKNGLVFGPGCSIGARTSIRPSSYYGGEVGLGMEVGARTSFATGCFLGCSGLISIGDDVMLGPGVQIQSENHQFEDPDRTIKEQGVRRSFVVVQDDCWIGANTIITAGVTVGRGSVVGAGSIVTRDIPPFSIAAGSPAKVLRPRGANNGGRHLRAGDVSWQG